MARWDCQLGGGEGGGFIIYINSGGDEVRLTEHLSPLGVASNDQFIPSTDADISAQGSDQALRQEITTD